jgi:hypothetical protein
MHRKSVELSDAKKVHYRQTDRQAVTQRVQAEGRGRNMSCIFFDIPGIRLGKIKQEKSVSADGTGRSCNQRPPLQKGGAPRTPRHPYSYTSLIILTLIYGNKS